MTMETALRKRLIDDAAVSAIVGARIDWTQRPQQSAYPAITLQVISDPRPQHMQGFIDFRETRVQVDCWSKTRAQAVAMREAVIAALAPAGTYSGVKFGRSFFPSGGVDRGESTDTGFVHRDQVDVMVWHNA